MLGNSRARHGNVHIFRSALSLCAITALEQPYQCDDGGTGAGERDDVEVVGQVELWTGEENGG